MTMKNKDNFVDKTKLFLGFQEEVLAAQNKPSSSIRIHLEQAATDLSPYFENPAIIFSALGAGGLQAEHAFLQQNRSKSWIDQNLRVLLAEFRSAQNANEALCFQTWGSRMEAIDRATRNWAAVAFLQEDLERLNPEFMAKSVLRNVGDILEGSLQPLVRLRLEMQGIAGMRTKTAKLIDSMTFGNVIEELASRQIGGSIYCPPPFGVTVSQWRNIANHNSYVVDGDEVVCAYGRPKSPQKIVCPVAKLYDLGVYVNDLSFMHKIAYEVFSVDNLEMLLPFAPKLKITDYTKEGMLAYGLAAAGFTIVKAGHASELWVLELIDRFARSKPHIEGALQTATHAYNFWAGSVRFFISVKSGSSTYRFRAEGKSADGNAEALFSFAGNMRYLAQYWRPDLSRNSQVPYED